MEEQSRKDVKIEETFKAGTEVIRYEKEVPVKEYIREHVEVERFLGFCKSCSNYGKNWSCSPFDYDPMEIWNRYDLFKVITYRFRPQPGMDTAAAAVMIENLKKEFMKDASEIEMKFPGSYALFAGTCSYCMSCAKVSGEPCRNPEKMRHSIESIGGDVARTIHDLFDIEIQWGSKDALPEYYVLCGGVLIRK